MIICSWCGSPNVVDTPNALKCNACNRFTEKRRQAPPPIPGQRQAPQGNPVDGFFSALNRSKWVMGIFLALTAGGILWYVLRPKEDLVFIPASELVPMPHTYNPAPSPPPVPRRETTPDEDVRISIAAEFARSSPATRVRIVGTRNEQLIVEAPDCESQKDLSQIMKTEFGKALGNAGFKRIACTRGGEEIATSNPEEVADPKELFATELKAVGILAVVDGRTLLVGAEETVTCDEVITVMKENHTKRMKDAGFRRLKCNHPRGPEQSKSAKL